MNFGELQLNAWHCPPPSRPLGSCAVASLPHCCRSMACNMQGRVLAAGPCMLATDPRRPMAQQQRRRRRRQRHVGVALTPRHPVRCWTSPPRLPAVAQMWKLGLGNAMMLGKDKESCDYLRKSYTNVRCCRLRTSVAGTWLEPRPLLPALTKDAGAACGGALIVPRLLLTLTTLALPQVTCVWSTDQWWPTPVTLSIDLWARRFMVMARMVWMG